MAAKEQKAKPEGEAGAEAAPKKGGRKKLILIVLPVLLLGLGAGGWFSGVLPSLLGLGPAQAEREANGGPPPPPPPRAALVDLPEIVSNLNAPGRRTSFVRLRARIEIADSLDAPAVEAAMPRLVDLFATYLREVRPEELRGSAGSYRLREELIARATIAMANAGRPNAPTPRVTDLLFVEILVQ